MAEKGKGRLELFEGEARKRKSPPGVKSFLILLNLQMDWLLDRIEQIEWSNDPILRQYETTEFERITLLLEDRRFFKHSGFDIKCIPRMMRQALTFKRIGGVSTIEQQLVRTILARRERTVRRKAREILLAWILSHRKDKQEILRAYLATAYFGHKLRGCDQAARLFFGKDAGEIEGASAAMVASLLVYPLPKKIRELAIAQQMLPTSDATHFLDYASKTEPKWARRVKRRMNYGLALRRQTK